MYTATARRARLARLQMLNNLTAVGKICGNCYGYTKITVKNGKKSQQTFF